MSMETNACSEDTDLERRVLAHEQILQALIAHMTEKDPAFLERLKDVFQNNHILGGAEHDFTATEQHADHFVRQIERIGQNTTPNTQTTNQK